MEDRVVPTIVDFGGGSLVFVPPGNNASNGIPYGTAIANPGSLLPTAGMGGTITAGNILTTNNITNTSNSTIAVALTIYNDPTAEAAGGTHHNLTAQKLVGYVVELVPAHTTVTLSIDVGLLALHGDAGERGFQADIVTISPSLLPAGQPVLTPITVTDIGPHDPLVDVTGGLLSKIGNGNNDNYGNRFYGGHIYNNTSSL